MRTHPVTFEVDAVDHEGKAVNGLDFEVDVKGPETVRPQLARYARATHNNIACSV